MNYQTVLQNYHPSEQGDFMLRYEIGGRGYVIYSPKKDVLSCIELHGFSELTPWQLAFVLSLDMQQMKEQDELSLSVCCKREKLLSYPDSGRHSGLYPHGPYGQALQQRLARTQGDPAAAHGARVGRRGAPQGVAGTAGPLPRGG